MRDGAESLRAGSGSGSLDERWARLGVFPSGNGRDEDRTQVLPPVGSDGRTEGLPGTGGRPGPAGAPRPGGEDRTQVLPEVGGRPAPPSRPGPAGGARRADGPAAPAGRDRFDAFGRPPAPAARRTADDVYDSERTTALRVPRPAASAAPAAVAPDAGATTRIPAADAAVPGDTGTAVRDPWQGEPGTHEATHDPHEVTVQLDAVQIGAGGVLSRTPGAGAAPEAAPVFVDESGRRNRLYRRIGLAVGLACAGYAVVMVSTLLSGNSDAPWMPVPGQEDKPAGQVETTPRPSATDPAPSPGTSLDPGLGTPTPGASDLPGPGASAPAAGGTGGTVQQPDGSATTPAGRASSQPATGGGDGGGGTAAETPPAGGGTATQPTTPTTPDDTAPPATSGPTGGGGEADGTDSLSAPSADRPVAAEPAAGADSAPAAPSPENVL
ncbi:hypothetical protein [Streptomyces albogriseolus]|uniref:hypothetical protein n=1 Tax=Streptomyces albogriseolus TaxID=1887 RepID=UPI0033BBAD35